MSKEIMVQDHAFFELLAFYGAVILISKKWGKSISKFAAERAQVGICLLLSTPS